MKIHTNVISRKLSENEDFPTPKSLLKFSILKVKNPKRKYISPDAITFNTQIVTLR